MRLSDEKLRVMSAADNMTEHDTADKADCFNNHSKEAYGETVTNRHTTLNNNIRNAGLLSYHLNPLNYYHCLT